MLDNNHPNDWEPGENITPQVKKFASIGAWTFSILLFACVVLLGIKGITALVGWII